MQIPFPIILLSYGDFISEKKLFSCDMDDIYTLPIFTDLEIAERYRLCMMSFMKDEFDDNRELRLQYSVNPKIALEMFEVLIMQGGIQNIVINPSPIYGESTTLSMTISAYEFIGILSDQI